LILDAGGLNSYWRGSECGNAHACGGLTQKLAATLVGFHSLKNAPARKHARVEVYALKFRLKVRAS
jgi:hypothetical protein